MILTIKGGYNMKKEVLDDKYNIYIFITLLIGFILNFIIESGMNIAILCFFTYMVNTCIKTTENIKEYSYYEFRDKEKFEKGKNLFAWGLYIYSVIRMITLVINPVQITVIPELLLLILLYGLYENHLTKKYVIRKSEEQEKIKVVLIRNKVLVSSILVLYSVFSYYTFMNLNNLQINEDVKYLKNEYKIENKDDTRKVQIKLGSTYMMGQESEENTAYFDNFLIKGKSVMKDEIIKSYSFISMIVMCLLCFAELYPKNKFIRSQIGTLFIMLFVIFIMITFNFDTHTNELNLVRYFHDKIS